MPAPAELLQLMQRFEEQKEQYLNQAYNETQVRREFIDPLLELLGWDVSNKAGYAEQYKDVVHEDSIKVGGATKAPDYSCRIGGQRKFFVEAKKPAVSLFRNPDPAYQLRRYGWSAKLPLSILTNFAEFAVYDCRVKPEQSDESFQARIMYLTYDQLAEKWDELLSLFSPEAIRKGAFDRYAQDNKKKRGTAEVDSAFLEEISQWREQLAENIALRNKESKLKSRDLSYAVQSTIDRLIFLRIAEDRGIEPYGRLLELTQGREIYPTLTRIFQTADAKYNSGLFHFKEEKGRSNDSLDTFTLALKIDDKVLKEIIKRLYYPDSPYQFNMIPADILGQVYEQFLGKVIRLTPKGQAKIEDKPEVKKAGGVFYTPTYIVQYIVEQTVGRLLEGQTAGEKGTASQLKICDPSCGSGSFLIGAYQYLLDWHLSQYTAAPEDIAKWRKGKNPPLMETELGGYRLTINERKRILLNNIYGVDIDQQAVEVTKLSLLLKVLEGETEQSLAGQMSLLHERVLPDLSQNIKCGNSLIAPDFYESYTPTGEDEEEAYRINVFDWHTAFPQVFAAGGFSAVIGNPPYVRQELLTEFKPYLANKFKVFTNTADLYVYFVEQGLHLLHPQGYFSYIMANKWMKAKYGQPLRQWLKKQHLVEIIDFGDLPVFPSASTYPCILVVKKGETPSSFFSTLVTSLEFTHLNQYIEENRVSINTTSLNDAGWTLVDELSYGLLAKLRHTGVSLGSFVDHKIFMGLKTGLNEAFVIDAHTKEKLINEDPHSSELIKPVFAGRDIKRYLSPQPHRFLILIPSGWTKLNSGNSNNPWKWFEKQYPAIAKHLSAFADIAKKRTDMGDFWWELRSCAYYDEFDKPKFILPDISLQGNFMLDKTGGNYCVNTAYIIGSSDKYLLAILNSKLITFFYKHLSSSYRGGYLRFIYQYLTQLPIRTMDPNNPSDKKLHTQIVTQVERMLQLSERLASAKTPQEKTVLQRQIIATDKQIDQLVYTLYGLTPEEIALVEA